MPYPLVLASTSKYRKNLLEQLGWPFESIAPGIDEDQLKNKGLSSEALAKELSLLKARAVSELRPISCIIGSDQVCTVGKVILSKPGNFEKAVEQLLTLQGTKHELITAVSLVAPSLEKTFVSRTVLHMRKLNRVEIERYLISDTPFDCAGSYKLESHGIRLFEKIEMDDHTSIIGLPLIELTNQLLKLGYSL